MRARKLADDMKPSLPASYEPQARRLIETVINADANVREGCPADAYLARLFRQNRAYGSKTRRLIADTVFSRFRWRGWLTREGKPADPATVALAHALDADQIHPLINYLAPFPVEPLRGLSLTKKAEKLVAVGAWPSPPEPEQLVPHWAPQQWTTPPDMDAIDYEKRLITSFQERPAIWLRFPRDTRDTGLRALSAFGHDAVPHPVLASAASISRAISREHAEHPSVPPFVFQDVSSQCVGLIANPQPCDRWWDVCAGAGGKTLHLADLMQYRGHVRATEPRDKAVRELQRRAQRQQVHTMIEVLQTDARDVASGRMFDGVLVDAPCSGMGTWSRAPDARWRISQEDIPAFTALQRALLQHGARSVRNGGVLTYAVCTLTAEETVSQVRAFEMDHPDFVPQSFIHPLTRETCRGHTWILPWQGSCGAMFVAKWRKEASNVSV